MKNFFFGAATFFFVFNAISFLGNVILYVAESYSEIFIACRNRFKDFKKKQLWAAEKCLIAICYVKMAESNITGLIGSTVYVGYPEGFCSD